MQVEHLVGDIFRTVQVGVASAGEGFIVRPETRKPIDAGKFQPDNADGCDKPGKTNRRQCSAPSESAEGVEDKDKPHLRLEDRRQTQKHTGQVLPTISFKTQRQNDTNRYRQCQLAKGKASMQRRQRQNKGANQYLSCAPQPRPRQANNFVKNHAEQDYVNRQPD